jgi:hypothetical protein
VIYAIAIGIGYLFGLDKQDLADFYNGEKTLGEDILAAAVVALALPIVISELGRRWRGSAELRPWALKKLGISPAHSVQSGWNELFGREGTMMLRVTLRDGRVVGGHYGDGSFAGYTEHTQDLLISQRWEMDEDGWFSKPAEKSLGLWLSHESIISIEAYEPSEN